MKQPPTSTISLFGADHCVRGLVIRGSDQNDLVPAIRLMLGYTYEMAAALLHLLSVVDEHVFIVDFGEHTMRQSLGGGNSVPEYADATRQLVELRRSDEDGGLRIDLRFTYQDLRTRGPMWFWLGLYNILATRVSATLLPDTPNRLDLSAWPFDVELVDAEEGLYRLGLVSPGDLHGCDLWAEVGPWSSAAEARRIA